MIKKYYKIIITVSLVAIALCGCSKTTNLSKEEITAMDKKLFYSNTNSVGGADPFVTYIEDGEYGNKFYMYATTGALSTKGFYVYESTNLTKWNMIDTAFEADASTWCTSKLWAPEVVYDEEDGAYYMFYSAQWGDMTYGLYISVAVSDNPVGPFREYSDNYKSMKEPLINFEENYNRVPESLRSDLVGYTGKKGFIKVIDASPFIDPVTNKKYLFFVADIGTDYTENSFVMAMEMADWKTPIYETLTRITEFGLTTVGGDEVIYEGGKTNEGPSVYYHNGKYYLTFSTFTYYTVDYQVRQAVSDSVLGPYTKIQPNDGGTVISTSESNVRQSAGHSCFFEVGDELWLAYHTLANDRNIDDGRKPAVDRLVFIKNKDGLEVLQANGTTSTLQPLPEKISGYKNVALNASVECENAISDVALLHDSLIPLRKVSAAKDCRIDAGKSTIKITLDGYYDIGAVMIYNSINEDMQFKSIDSIELKGKGNNNKFVNLVFESNVDSANKKVVYDKALIVESSATSVNEITIKINSDEAFAIGEIIILGK